MGAWKAHMMEPDMLAYQPDIPHTTTSLRRQTRVQMFA